MKYGYQCPCGWDLKRGLLTRPQYANAKREHAAHCKQMPLRERRQYSQEAAK